MNERDIAEQAYKNGYEAGKKDAEEEIRVLKQKRVNIFERLEAYGKGKAAGVKEFAEKLKERKYQSSDWSHGEHPFVVEETDIDELLEEMVCADPAKGE